MHSALHPGSLQVSVLLPALTETACTSLTPTSGYGPSCRQICFSLFLSSVLSSFVYFSVRNFMLANLSSLCIDSTLFRLRYATINFQDGRFLIGRAKYQRLSN